VNNLRFSLLFQTKNNGLTKYNTYLKQIGEVEK